MVARVFRTALGWMGAAARGDRLVAVVLPEARKDSAVAALAARGATDATQVASPLLDRVQADLTRYCAGERVDFSSYPVELGSLTPFHQAALKALRHLRAGQVRSYAWVAGQAGHPRAARAAGQAMHANPLPIIFPCHRVVGSNGALTGFGGGLALKRRLLTLEGVAVTGDRVVPPTSEVRI